MQSMLVKMAKRKLFHGTMNASKSAQILFQTFNFERQGKTFACFKPELDREHDKGFIKSRALSEKRPAFFIKKEWNGMMFDIVENMQPDFVFVDEIQFMTPSQVEELARISVELDIPVFAYGLLLSYTGHLFEGSKRAVECGFGLQELKMQCDFCSNKSTHHILYLDGEAVVDGDGIRVGDTEYKSVCYSCYSRKTNKRNK
jgi:thymidine kinase